MSSSSSLMASSPSASISLSASSVHSAESLSVPASSASSASDTSPNSSASRQNTASSTYQSEARLQSWYEKYKAGGMDDARLLHAAASLLDLSGDILVAQGDTVRSCLMVLRLRSTSVGKAGSEKRGRLLSVIAQLQARLAQQRDQFETKDTEEDESDEEEEDTGQEKEREQHQSSSSSSPRQSRSSVRRTASAPDYGASSHSPPGISDLELALVQSLSELDVVDKGRMAALSVPGKQLLQQLRSQKKESLASSFNISTASQPAAAGPSLSSQRRVSDLPPLNFSLPQSHKRAAVRSRSRRSDRSSSDSDSDSTYSASSSHSSVDEESTVGSGLSRHVRRVLVRWGVPEGLKKDNILDQTANMVSPTSYHSFWSNKHELIKTTPAYFEGLVLSLILDHADDPDVWKELAARRWFSLWMVSNGAEWGSAQAFLPLTTTPGLTARQQQVMTKFFKAQSRTLSSDNGASSSRRKKNNYRRSPGRGKREKESEGSSKREEHKNGSNKGRRGAGAKDNKQSAASSTDTK